MDSAYRLTSIHHKIVDMIMTGIMSQLSDKMTGIISQLSGKVPEGLTVNRLLMWVDRPSLCTSKMIMLWTHCSFIGFQSFHKGRINGKITVWCRVVRVVSSYLLLSNNAILLHRSFLRGFRTNHHSELLTLSYRFRQIWGITHLVLEMERNHNQL